jgi:hypothetical protein
LKYRARTREDNQNSPHCGDSVKGSAGPATPNTGRTTGFGKYRVKQYNNMRFRFHLVNGSARYSARLIFQ